MSIENPKKLPEFQSNQQSFNRVKEAIAIKRAEWKNTPVPPHDLNIEDKKIYASTFFMRKEIEDICANDNWYDISEDKFLEIVEEVIKIEFKKSLNSFLSSLNIDDEKMNVASDFIDSWNSWDISTHNEDLNTGWFLDILIDWVEESYKESFSDFLTRICIINDKAKQYVRSETI